MITLYTLNILQFCQLYLNKSGRKNCGALEAYHHNLVTPMITSEHMTRFTNKAFNI